MYPLLLALAVAVFAVLKAREHFGLVIGTPDIITTDTKTEEGVEIFSTYPNTCPKDRPELDAGLCYPRCRAGFHGIGPVCWADSVNVGVGIPVGLNPCPDGWNNDGLICRQPITNDCSWKWLGICWGRLRGGNLRGRLNPYCPKPMRVSGDGYDTSQNDCRWDPKNPQSQLYPKTMGVCVGPGALSNDHPEYVDGLCYKRCPINLPARIPGMPYLCYKGEGLSYGRGVGRVPNMVRFGRIWSPF